MAKSFIYPVSELRTATLTDGSHNGTTFTSGTTLTNEEFITDQSIGHPVGSFEQGNALRIDFGTAITSDTAAFYFNAIETDSLTLYASDNSDASSHSLEQAITDDFILGWTVKTLAAEQTRRYWFIRSTSAGGLVGLTEIIIGIEYTFDVNFPTGDDEFDRSNVDIIKSGGKQEYANKKAELQRIWNWKWEIPTSAMRTSLRAFDAAVDKNFLKFIFYNDEDSTNYWVRMSADSLKFKRVHFNYWETNVKLTQQLI